MPSVWKSPTKPARVMPRPRKSYCGSVDCPGVRCCPQCRAIYKRSRRHGPLGPPGNVTPNHLYECDPSPNVTQGHIAGHIQSDPSMSPIVTHQLGSHSVSPAIDLPPPGPRCQWSQPPCHRHDTALCEVLGTDEGARSIWLCSQHRLRLGLS